MPLFAPLRVFIVGGIALLSFVASIPLELPDLPPVVKDLGVPPLATLGEGAPTFANDAIKGIIGE